METHVTVQTPTRKAKKQSSSDHLSANMSNDANNSSGASSDANAEDLLGLRAGEGLRRRRKAGDASRDYDEVDDRITIPLGSSSSAGRSGGKHRISVGVSTGSVRTGASSLEPLQHRNSESILQSGISKYRSLSGKLTPQATLKPTASSSSSSSLSFATTSTSTTTTTTTTTPAASTTSSPTVIIPGASLKVHMNDDHRISQSFSHNRSMMFPGAVSRLHHSSHHQGMGGASTIASPSSSRYQLHRRDEPVAAMSIVVPENNPFDHALQLVAQKQYAAAIPFLTEALNATSSSASGSSSNAAVQHQSKLKLYFQRGNCYLAAQKYKQAVEDFTQVISLTPKNAQLFAKRGKAFAHLNQHHAALSDYNEAINISASSNGYGYPGPSANRAELRGLYLARSKVYRAMNNMSLELEDLHRAESAGGDRDPEVYYQRAQLYTRFRQDELALKDQTKFLKLQEEAAHQELNADKHASGSGDARDRVQEMRLQRARILRQLAAEKDVQRRLDGKVLATEEGGRSSTAITSDQRNQHRPTGYRSAEAIDLVLQAIDDYTQVLEMDPENTEVLRFRGDAYSLIDKYDEALADFAQALELEPHDFAVHMSRAKLYQQQNDLQKAIDEITSVLQVNGFFMDALFFRAKLFEQIGNIDKAKRDYTSLIDAHYDVRGDAATNSNELANEKTPLLSKGGTSSSSSSRAFNAKSPQAMLKPAKIISKHTVQALLFRARLSVQMNQFDDAITDYNCILASDPAHIEAQMELPGTESKKKAFEEKAHLDAIEWVKDQQLREEEARKNAQGNGSGAASLSSKSKKKKKKKRKKRPTQTEYVLLEDEEDDEAFVRDREEASPQEEAGSTVVATEQSVEEEEPAAAAAVSVVEEESEHNFTESVAASTSSNALVSVVVTRDEACESMWEQSEDQTDSEEVNQEDGRVESQHSVAAVRDETAEDGEEEQDEAVGDVLQICRVKTVETTMEATIQETIHRKTDQTILQRLTRSVRI
uniref:UDP-N-acetylglucosamine--peptide N-acetylglucosaminyltransferase SPINDLY n=1 Tax=Globisporangium ultimum (strain ATCC 200006 / CBS 805.95 / DAOM BR144) TaxID=431595 RepID=K3WF31_GLOUD